MSRVEFTRKQDVYDAHWHAARADRVLDAAELHVVLERNPAALARIFDLLCLLSLVPQRVESVEMNPEDLGLTLYFGPVAALTADLLVRKVSQLADCLDVRLKVLTPVLGSHAVTP